MSTTDPSIMGQGFNNTTELRTGALLNDEPEIGPNYNYNEDAIAIVVPIVFGVIFILGLIGNVSVICAVLRYKSMRNAPNLFIVNLAFGDILLILISIPTSAMKYTLHTWVFGSAFCQLSYFIQTLSLGVSIFTLTMLSVDRALVISQTMKHLQEKASQRITIMLTAVWVLAILIALPDAVTYHMKTYRFNISDGVYNEVAVCQPYPSDWEFNYKRFHIVMHMMAFFILPVIIITVCYSIMARIMVSSSNNLPGESLKSSVWRRKQSATRKRIAYTVIILIVLFFVCWLPRNIWLLILAFSEEMIDVTPAIHYFRIVAYCLKFANSCVNPVALFFLSKSFRSQLCCVGDGVKEASTEFQTPHSNTNRGCQMVKLNSTTPVSPPDTNITQSTDTGLQ